MKFSHKQAANPRIVDSHLHFWSIGGPGQTWPDADWPLIYRDFGPPDLRQAAAGIELVGAVLVQSQPADRDTDWMFDTVRDDPLVGAIVAWVDLASEDAPTRIAELARRPKLRGLRPMLQAIEDSRWILRPELRPALTEMIRHRLSFDALVQPRHLPVLVEFARQWPELQIVIDHGAKPFAARRELDPWRAQIAALATLPNIYCKLSGLRTEQAPGQPAAQLRPYVEHLVASFPNRLMWGSDWPVLLHATDSYADWLALSQRLTGLSQGPATNALFCDTARHFYRLA